ncbi:hypothetical protein AVEN_28356-1 [Araneus ventricosus]|uniref:Uncharacterized protein n=1 Tax=Araneus ventricosus TaxID=182803 RepID=A0A4Y2F8S3_ARAVE|nr:hypothetical protein AVEN_28356-1 [Araneus ventricosus]
MMWSVGCFLPIYRDSELGNRSGRFAAVGGPERTMNICRAKAWLRRYGYRSHCSCKPTWYSFLGYDGLHLNQRGNHHLASLFCGFLKGCISLDNASERYVKKCQSISPGYIFDSTEFPPLSSCSKQPPFLPSWPKHASVNTRHPGSHWVAAQPLASACPVLLPASTSRPVSLPVPPSLPISSPVLPSLPVSSPVPPPFSSFTSPVPPSFPVSLPSFLPWPSMTCMGLAVIGSAQLFVPVLSCIPVPRLFGPENCSYSKTCDHCVRTYYQSFLFQII